VNAFPRFLPRLLFALCIVGLLAQNAHAWIEPLHDWTIGIGNFRFGVLQSGDDPTPPSIIEIFLGPVSFTVHTTAQMGLVIFIACMVGGLLLLALVADRSFALLRRDPSQSPP